MKITDIQFEKVQIKLKEPIVVAFATLEYGETILLKLKTDEGVIGYGEAAPFAPVTGETLDGTLIVLKEMKKILTGMGRISLRRMLTVLSFLMTTSLQAVLR